MKKNIFSFLFLLLFLVLAVSCSEASVSGKTYLITVGDTYYDGGVRNIYIDGIFIDRLRPSQLKTPQNDCNAIAQQVKTLNENVVEKKFFNTGTSGSYYTWSDIEEYIKDLPINAEDLLILFYSGHGMNETGWLCTRYKDGYELISPEKVLGTLSSVSGYKVFITDSCYSGNFVVDSTLEDSKIYSSSGMSFDGYSPAISFKVSFTNFNIDSSYKQKYPNTWVLSAVTSFTPAPERPPYGILSENVLLFLGAKKDEEGYYQPTTSCKGKTLTLYDMYKYIFDNYSSEGYIESFTPLVTRSTEDVILFGR